MSTYFPYDWCNEIKSNQKSDIMNSFTTCLITHYFASEWTLVTTKKVNQTIKIGKSGVRLIISRRNIQILFAQILFFGINVFIRCFISLCAMVLQSFIEKLKILLYIWYFFISCECITPLSSFFQIILNLKSGIHFTI